MNNHSLLVNSLNKKLINKYAHETLSRQERLHIIDSLRSSLPENIKSKELSAYKYFTELNNNENIDLKNGFANVNVDSINNLIENELNIEKIIANKTDLDSFGTRQKGTKSYFISKTSFGDYSFDHPIIKLATDPIILGSITNYLGEAPLIHDCSIFYSPVVNENSIFSIRKRAVNLRKRIGLTKYQGSQLWHIDEDYPHTIKLWVYLTDVDENSGPLNILPGPISDEVINLLGKNSSKKVSDRKLKEYNHHKISIEGKAKSVFLVDTGRCFHFGSRDVKSKTGRMAIVIHYTSILSRYTFIQKVLNNRTSNLEKLLSKGSNPVLDQLTRY